MKKAVGLFVASLALLFVFTTFSSAYSYYGGYHNPWNGGDYDSYSYHSSRNNNGYVRTTDYDRTTESYWNGYEWVDRTVYTRETRQGNYNYYSPYGYNSYSYPNYYYSFPSNYNRNNYYYGYGRYW